MTTISITIPDNLKEREEVLTYLESKGLVNRDEISTLSKEALPKKSKWAVFAEKMHHESPLDGESENFAKVTRQFRENFSF
jgi:hypothetical protein